MSDSVFGKALTDANIHDIVNMATSADPTSPIYLPPSNNAIYVVLTASDVTATSGFCTSYCGWHTSNNDFTAVKGAYSLKYSFVGKHSSSAPVLRTSEPLRAWQGLACSACDLTLCCFAVHLRAATCDTSAC
jgi:hypothetical protein